MPAVGLSRRMGASTKGESNLLYLIRSADGLRRLLISQDYTEIYLTIAEFEPAYKEYVCGNRHSKVSPLSLMTMSQYGPWETWRSDHMAQLGKLVLALL